MKRCQLQKISSTVTKENEKYLIVGLNLDQGRCIIAWKAEQQP